MQLKKILLLAVLPVLLCPLRLGAENQPGIKASLEKGKVLLDIPDSLLGRTWAMASTSWDTLYFPLYFSASFALTSIMPLSVG